MAIYSLYVWTEPHAGQEDEYNDWYSNTHLADLLKIPEFVGARRVKFENGTPMPRKYLAIYDVDTTEPDTIIDRVVAAGPDMFISPALNIDSVIMSVFGNI